MLRYLIAVKEGDFYGKRNAILMIAVTAVVIPGFFMMKRIDVFL